MDSNEKKKKKKKKTSLEKVMETGKSINHLEIFPTGLLQ